jgi:hypothetical protein
MLAVQPREVHSRLAELSITFKPKSNAAMAPTA